MFDVFLDALLDSFKIFIVVFIFYILLSFFEAKLSTLLEKNKKVSPILGSAFGLIPQCGVSVIASDLYLKNHITMGTLVAIFISCSDEALPILFSSGKKIIYIILLLIIKFIIGFIVGFTIDLILTKKKEEVKHHHDHCHHEKEIHIGCCHHQIDNEEEDKLHNHLIHPLLHSLKLFLYIFIINLIFGFIVFTIGEEAFTSFLVQNKYLTPLFSSIVGLIPNCASSVIIAELFIIDALPFGGLIAGLIMNAGLGTVYIIKDKNHKKDTLVIFIILFIVSNIVGYLSLLVE